MKIIGVSGLARSGKDTIADALEKEIKNSFPNLNVQRVSLAQCLKEEMAPFLKEKFNVDVFELDGEEKERFRPLLVAYGYAKRIATKGGYFTSMLQQRMDIEKADVYIISDIRYADNEADELFWLKNQNGKLIHIKRFDLVADKKKYFKAPNEDEKRNDPVLHKNADFQIDWPSAKTPEDLKIMSKKLCESFVMNNIKYFL